MTKETKTKPATEWDYIQADPDYLAAVEAGQQARKAAQLARTKAFGSLFRIRHLMLAAEATGRQMWKLENMPDEDSDKLEAVTGDCGGCWFEAWSAAEDVVQDAAMAAVLNSADLVNAWRQAQAVADACPDAVMAARDAAAQRFKGAA